MGGGGCAQRLGNGSIGCGRRCIGCWGCLRDLRLGKLLLLQHLLVPVVVGVHNVKGRKSKREQDGTQKLSGSLSQKCHEMGMRKGYLKCGGYQGEKRVPTS